MCHHREDKVKVVFDKNACISTSQWDVCWTTNGQTILKSFYDAEEAMEYASHINALETDIER